MHGRVEAWSGRSHRPTPAIDWSELRVQDFGVSEAAALASEWAARAREEQVAMVAFERLGSELADSGAAPALVQAFARVVSDEAHHVELCRQVATAMGSPHVNDTPERLPRTDGRYPGRERTALALMGWICVGESWSAAVFAHQLQNVTHPVLRAVEKEILADEVSHGRLGFAWLADTWMTLPMSSRLLVERLLPDMLLALARRQPPSRRDLYDVTINGRILPELERAGVRVRRLK
jgi:hypothetical protein